MNILTIAVTLGLLIAQSSQLALILVRMEPYCFSTTTDKANDLKFSYVASGLNEDQIEFRVSFIDVMPHILDLRKQWREIV